MTLFVCLCDFLTLWMSERLCPSILTPHFLWQQSFLSQMPVENATMEESEIRRFHNHVSLLQWLKVKHQEYTGVYMAAATITVSGWCPGNHLLLFPFVLHRSLCFTVNWLDLWWGMRHLKIDIMVFAPFSVPQVKQKEGVFSSLFFFETSSEVIQWISKKLKRKLVLLKGKAFRKMMSSSSIKCGADSRNWEGDQNPGTYHKNITSSPLWPEATWAFHYIRASHGVLFITTLPYLKVIPTWL